MVKASELKMSSILSEEVVGRAVGLLVGAELEGTELEEDVTAAVLTFDAESCDCFELLEEDPAEEGRLPFDALGTMGANKSSSSSSSPNGENGSFLRLGSGTTASDTGGGTRDAAAAAAAADDVLVMVLSCDWLLLLSIVAVIVGGIVVVRVLSAGEPPVLPRPCLDGSRR